MKIKYILLCGVGIVSVIVTLVLFSNPLRKSNSNIQAWLQEKTPLGMSYLEVKKEIEIEGWFNPNSQGSDGKTPKIYLRGELGRYLSVPFFTYVTVFWEFDQDNRLRNIRIWKTTDAL